MDIRIIKLPTDRWEEYRDLRLEALKEEPTAFSSSYEENSQHSEELWKDWLSNMSFAQVDGALVGMMGILKNKEIKRKHAVSIVSVYVKKEFRNKGVGKRLMEAALEEAGKDPDVIKVDLDVSTENEAAVNLYKSFGFKVVGTWGKEIKVDDKYYDLYEMEKFLDESL